jgi:CDP-glycerol glycerophosphotransferase
LWHGKSLKKTGYNSPYSLTRYNRFLSGNLFLKPRKFIAISEFFAQYVVSDFRVPPADVLCSGLPKHDPLFRKVPGSELDMDISLHSHMRQARAQGAAHLVLYAPTFRPTGKNPLDGIDFTSINNVLEKQNSHMFVTLHPKFSTKAWSSSTSFTRITFCESEGDVYPLLREFDVLVSDYSSLVIEFLMMRKPIILYAFDYEEYTKTMGLYSELWELVPAQKVMTGQGLVTALEDLTVNTAATEAAWEKIFTFDDGLSSARIADYLLRDDK